MTNREDPLRRGRVIRRRKKTAAAEAEPEPTAASKADAPAEAQPKAPTPTQQVDTPKPARVSPRVDGEALLAEIDNMSMADLASLMGGGSPSQLQAGAQVTGTVVRVSAGSVFLDIGAKSEAVVDATEFELDGPPSVGSTLTVFVGSADDDGIRASRQPSGDGAWRALESAAETETPVQGRVESVNPGGFTVRLGSIRAFCPRSHISRLRPDDLESFIGREMTFRVTSVEGRDVVVSRRVIEEEESASSAAEVWAELREGDTRSGIITATKDFGAFVDIDGVQALIPRREFGWAHDAAAPNVGTRVEVRIISIDSARRKVAASLKDPSSRPWGRVGIDFVEGETYTGKVSRLTDFGAFVSLAPGIEGLVHVSRIAEERINHPSDRLEADQQVSVTVLRIDHDRERLELSMRPADRSTEPSSRSTKAPKPQNQSLGTLGDLFAGITLPKS